MTELKVGMEMTIKGHKCILTNIFSNDRGMAVLEYYDTVIDATANILLDTYLSIGR